MRHSDRKICDERDDSKFFFKISFWYSVCVLVIVGCDECREM